MKNEIITAIIGILGAVVLITLAWFITLFIDGGASADTNVPLVWMLTGLAYSSYMRGVESWRRGKAAPDQGQYLEKVTEVAVKYKALHLNYHDCMEYEDAEKKVRKELEQFRQDGGK